MTFWWNRIAAVLQIIIACSYLAFACTNCTIVSIEITAKLPSAAHLLVIREERGNWNWRQLNKQNELFHWRNITEETLEFHVPSGECHQFTASRFDELSVQVDGRKLLSEDLTNLPPGEINEKAPLFWYAGDCSAPQCDESHALFELELSSGDDGYVSFDWMIKEKGSTKPLTSCTELSNTSDDFHCSHSGWFRRERLCLPKDSCYEMIWISGIWNVPLIGNLITAQARFDGAVIFNGAFQPHSFQFGSTCPDQAHYQSSLVELFYYAEDRSDHPYTGRPSMVQYQLYNRGQQVSGPIETMIVPFNNQSLSYYLGFKIPSGFCAKLERFQCSDETDFHNGRLTYNGIIYAESSFYNCPKDDNGGGASYFVGECADTYCPKNEASIELVVEIPHPRNLPFKYDGWNAWKITSEGEYYHALYSPNGNRYHAIENTWVNFHCVARDSCALLDFYRNQDVDESYYVLVDGSPVQPTATLLNENLSFERITTRLIDKNCPLSLKELKKREKLRKVARAAVIISGFLVGVILSVLWKRWNKRREDGRDNRDEITWGNHTINMTE